jgi:hypothetical protein|tara:strand:- start:117 stop:668 length:552 start_codon:yes stop_codon:yes gene_type:complete
MAIIEAIDTIYLEADVSSVEFTSIPSTYEHLELTASCHSDGTTSSELYYESLYVQLGTGGGAADAGTNYSNAQIWSYYNSVGGGNSTGNGGYYGIFATEVKSGTQRYGTGRVLIMDYANANKNCSSFNDMGGAFYNTASNYTEIVGSVWDNTGAVDRVKVVPYTGSQILSRGSTFSLYGIKSS